jgi:hypothetical protein
MKFWDPQPSHFRYVLLLSPLVSLVLAFWFSGLLSSRLSRGDYDPGVYLLGLGLFLSLVLAGLLAYLAYCAFSIRYALDDTHLVIMCGGANYLVPLESVTAVHAPGDAIDFKSVVVKWRGAAGIVPGYTVGVGRSAQLGRVVSVATAPVHGQVFVRTPRVTFGVSPRNPAEFIAELEKRRQLAAASSWKERPGTVLSGPGSWAAALWSDPLARALLVAGLVLNALLFGYLSLVYSGLPLRLPLHWNVQAQVDRVGDPLELVRLPVFALAVWLVNAVIAWWALRRERAVTLFLLAGALAAQVVFWAGALSIVLRAL